MKRDHDFGQDTHGEDSAVVIPADILSPSRHR
jgi:hypothetical protein